MVAENIFLNEIRQTQKTNCMNSLICGFHPLSLYK